MNIMFVINSLNVGGAERMLGKLATNEAFANDTIMVVTLISSGVLEKDFSGPNHQVTSLNLTRNPFSWLRSVKLLALIRKHKPDVIHSWLYQSDLIASMAARLSGARPVIWSLRQSNLSARHNKPMTTFCMRLCAYLSSFIPIAIVSCSKGAMAAHSAIGYAVNKIKIIPNGFALSEFTNDKAGAKRIRAEIGIGKNVPLVGMVGRFDSQKNHAGFFNMAKSVLAYMPNTHFCLVGQGVTNDNPKLRAMMEVESINPDQVHFLGARQDIVAIMSALDVLALPSDGEAFPNVVGEAMACETPCVVTNVGDCADIVGTAGKVVPVGEMIAFAAEILDILSKSKSQRAIMGQAARAHVKKFYDIDKVARQYRDVYTTCVAQSKRPF
jgi:glycosyltransferase involved in cell wall biosynthesis